MGEFISILKPIRNISTNSKPNIDDKYGPYNDLNEAKGSINSNERAIGLTIGIITNDGIVEYWWKNGTSDNDLVIKAVDETIIEEVVDGVIDTKLENYYTKTEVDTKLEDYYTKDEIDTTLDSYYTKTEVDNTFVSTASLATTLEDYYTKTEANNTFVAKTQIASSTVAGLIKVSDTYGAGLSSETIQATILTASNFNLASDNLFVGKGTLNNVLHDGEIIAPSAATITFSPRRQYILNNRTALTGVLPANGNYQDYIYIIIKANAAFTPSFSGGNRVGETPYATIAGKTYEYLFTWNGTAWCLSTLYY